MQLGVFTNAFWLVVFFDSMSNGWPWQCIVMHDTETLYQDILLDVSKQMRN